MTSPVVKSFACLFVYDAMFVIKIEEKKFLSCKMWPNYIDAHKADAIWARFRIVL